jgi:hypothetical protein
LKTLRICNVYVTLKEITQLEIAASSSTDIQERATTETRKEDNQKKDEENLGDKRFQQTPGQASYMNHHGGGTSYSQIP